MKSSALVWPERIELARSWTILRTAAGTSATPEDIEWSEQGDGLLLAEVEGPGTVGSALRSAGRLDLDDPASIEALGDLDDADFWLRCQFAQAGAADELVFDGLATLAEVWLNGEPILSSENMFVPRCVDVSGLLVEHNELVIRIRSLTDATKRKLPRARWRTRLASASTLRGVRTTLFGRMPSWCPPVPPVGAWGGIALRGRRADAISVEAVDVFARLDGEQGQVEIEATLAAGEQVESSPEQGSFFLELDGTLHALEAAPDRNGRIGVRGTATLDHVERWWPHTHLDEGASPRRYETALVYEDDHGVDRLELEPVSFRTIEREPGPRFALCVNGERVFCRGTCWTPIDPLVLRTDEVTLRRALEQARDAGINMLRVTSMGVYEQDAFYRLCDELGILVWQDFMFATFDYPTGDEAFRASVEEEALAFLSRVRSRACLAVLCGNGEGQQQPAMMGLGPESWESDFFDAWLPEACARLRPDVPWWTSTPAGGELPFHTREGTTHYFGVGSYRRELSDLESARPAFATECLAFANRPGTRGADLSRPERVPRDSGADWDFSDITKHYRQGLFRGAGADPERVAALDRATSALVMERVMSTLRRGEADCGGALVLLHRDPWACAGWGVLDADGRPKSAWYGLSRAWAPVHVSIFDAGLEGLRVHVTNDRPSPLEARLEVALLRFDGRTVDAASIPLRLAPRNAWAHSIDVLLGGFVDSSNAYRFGPRAFDVCRATLVIEGEEEGRAPEAIHLLDESGIVAAPADGLSVRWSAGRDGRPELVLTAGTFAQCVAIDLEHAVPEDNFFHLAPGRSRRLRLRAEGERPIGAATVDALNARAPVTAPAPSAKGRVR